LITLYLFGTLVEGTVGKLNFILIYIGSLIGGNLFALYMHRNHSDYSAIGASGAVSGIVFAAIGLIPGLTIGKLLIPGLHIYGWLY